MCPNFSNRGGLGAKPLAKNCCQKRLNQCLSLDWPKLKCSVIPSIVHQFKIPLAIGWIFNKEQVVRTKRKFA